MCKISTKIFRSGNCANRKKINLRQCKLYSTFISICSSYKNNCHPDSKSAMILFLFSKNAVPRTNKYFLHLILFVIVTLSRVQGVRKTCRDVTTGVRIYGAENYSNIIDGQMELSVIKSSVGQ